MTSCSATVVVMSCRRREVEMISCWRRRVAIMDRCTMIKSGDDELLNMSMMSWWKVMIIESAVNDRWWRVFHHHLQHHQKQNHHHQQQYYIVAVWLFVLSVDFIKLSNFKSFSNFWSFCKSNMVDLALVIISLNRQNWFQMKKLYYL